MQITTSWHEKGKIERKIEDICKFLAKRFSADYNETALPGLFSKHVMSCSLDTSTPYIGGVKK